MDRLKIRSESVLKLATIVISIICLTHILLVIYKVYQEWN